MNVRLENSARTLQPLQHLAHQECIARHRVLKNQLGRAMLDGSAQKARPAPKKRSVREDISVLSRRTIRCRAGTELTGIRTTWELRANVGCAIQDFTATKLLLWQCLASALLATTALKVKPFQTHTTSAVLEVTSALEDWVFRRFV